MTNAMLILMERVELMNAGKIGSTGRSIQVEIDGETKTFQEPEPIHTYAVWKELGYQVKRGEKAISRLNIWKHIVKKPKTEEEEKPQEKMIMKTAYFFSPAQVEKIA